MKKKVIFMVINMNVGGTEKALLNMIAEMPKEKYDITVLMLEKDGGFLDYIPDHVHLEYVKEYPKLKDMLNKPPKIMIANLLRKRNLFRALSLFCIYSLTKITNNRAILFSFLLKDVPTMEKKYDIAVAYAGPMDFISYFVVKKIKAKRKLQWIHFDVTKVGFNKKFVQKTYQQFDKLYAVSKEGKQKFIKEFPEMEDKVDVFTNVISPEQIQVQANNNIGFQDKYPGIRILTVGRLSKEKGQDLAISVLLKLKESGLHVRWYCIGEGSARSEYEQLIEQHHLEQDFILLGANPNPYPFMKECDIYVQPSKHEGYCITLAEAKILRKPIITTNFTGAQEQIIHQKTGLIVDMKQDQLYESIKELIINPKQRKKLSENLQGIIENYNDSHHSYNFIQQKLV